jgi:transcription elongation factor Elf1
MAKTKKRPARKHKTATCNACGSDIFFDAYVDINGEARNTFEQWVCSGCDNSGKYDTSNSGYTVKEIA